MFTKVNSSVDAHNVTPNALCGILIRGKVKIAIYMGSSVSDHR